MKVKYKYSTQLFILYTRLSEIRSMKSISKVDGDNDYQSTKIKYLPVLLVTREWVWNHENSKHGYKLVRSTLYAALYFVSIDCEHRNNISSWTADTGSESRKYGSRTLGGQVHPVFYIPSLETEALELQVLRYDLHWVLQSCDGEIHGFTPQ